MLNIFLWEIEALFRFAVFWRLEIIFIQHFYPLSDNFLKPMVSVKVVALKRGPFSISSSPESKRRYPKIEGCAEIGTTLDAAMISECAKFFFLGLNVDFKLCS